MTQEEATRLFYMHVWPLRAVVLRAARYLTRDPAEADDLAQETLVKAYRSIESFDVSSHAAAWLTAILRNTQIDRARARRREANDLSLHSHAMDLPDKGAVSSDVDLTNAAAILERLGDERIIEALQRLPEDIRWTLLLVDVEQLDHALAATVMGVPVGTVKSRTHRGHRMLRDMLLANVKNRAVSGTED